MFTPRGLNMICRTVVLSTETSTFQTVYVCIKSCSLTTKFLCIPTYQCKSLKTPGIMKSIAFMLFPLSFCKNQLILYRIGSSTGADLAIRVLISSTSFEISTKTPSFSGWSSGRPISLILTCPAASSSSPRITANGMPAFSAALNCCGSFGLSLYANSALVC